MSELATVLESLLPKSDLLQTYFLDLISFIKIITFIKTISLDYTDHIASKAYKLENVF